MKLYMGSDSSSTSKERQEFENLTMDVYISGKYNKLMEVLIGNKNSINENQNNNINIEDFLSSNTNNQYESRLKENGKPFEANNAYFTNWNLYFYCDEALNETDIKDIRDRIKSNYEKNKKNSVIFFINSEKDIYKIIDIFDEIHNEYHPLFLFIIKDENFSLIENNIKEYIKKKKYFTFRNITLLQEISLLETSNDEQLKKKQYEYISSTFLFLINSWFYFNNLGDDCDYTEKYLKNNSNEILTKINKEKLSSIYNEKSALFNILFLGRPGVGKSTLINLLARQKRTMESMGSAVTKNIARYVIENNISLFDTPGFETNEEVEQIKELIQDLNYLLIQRKNQIHVIFYLIHSKSGRDFLDSEKSIIELLYKNNIPIFFLLTFADNLPEAKDFQEIIEMNLRDILRNIGGKWKSYYRNEIKIIPVHLLNENDGSCKSFGLKTLLIETYTKFEKCIIKDDEREKLEEYLKDLNINENKLNNMEMNVTEKKNIPNILSQNKLYKYMDEINEIIKTNQPDNNNVYLIIVLLLGLFSLPIFKLFKENILINTANSLKIINKGNKKNIEKLINKNQKLINEETRLSLPIVASYRNYYSLFKFQDESRKLLINELEEKSIKGNKNNLMEIIDSLNKAINGLNKLSKNINE